MKSDSLPTNKTRSLPSRSRSRPTQRPRGGSHDVTPPKRSDLDGLQHCLENLKISFSHCTFTFKPTHLNASALSTKKRSKLASLRSKIFKGISNTIHEAVSCDKTYTSCVFTPTEQKDKVKTFICQNFGDITLSFENCKFIQRSSSLTEKIVRRLRSIFGLQFEVLGIASLPQVVSIDHYTFRVKDILFINQHVQQRIVDDE